MDSPQYIDKNDLIIDTIVSFKPYYKWIVLNTIESHIASLQKDMF